MRTIIRGGCIVNEGQRFIGNLIIEGEKLVSIERTTDESQHFQQEIDATGCFVFPGIIDEHVHFREPGLTEKADMESESRAAAAGGVTSFFDMPNTVPQTTTLESLEEKFMIAAEKSHVNYSFFFGATNDNAHLFAQLDPHRIPGIKLFMGSSTGNMLVDREAALHTIFSQAPLPIMVHCEDTAIINQNMAHFRQLYGEDPAVLLHPLIRSTEACVSSTAKAVALARQHGARLHVAHVTTREELALLSDIPGITAEATVGHLWFEAGSYQQLGARIKVNPAIKGLADRQELRAALTDGRITVVATDHAPHLLSQKEGGAARAASGMPMIQYSLVAMLELADEGILSLEQIVQLMAHHPAQLFEVRRRGFLRPGYQADIVIVRPNSPWTVEPKNIQSKCGWSPLEGHTFQWRIEKTLCNGHLVYSDGNLDTGYIGQPIQFR